MLKLDEETTKEVSDSIINISHELYTANVETINPLECELFKKFDPELNEDEFTSLKIKIKSELKIGDEWFLLNMEWYKKWVKNTYTRAQLSPIPNNYIDDEYGCIHIGLQENVHYKLVPKEVYNKLVAIYGIDNDICYSGKVMKYSNREKPCVVIITILFNLIILLIIFDNVNCLTPSFKIDYNPTLSLIKEYNQSQLYSLSSDGYQDPIYVANLTGSHYEIGYAIGYFFNEAFYENYLAIIDTVLPEWYERDLLDIFMNWQWNDFLSKQFPQEYMDEIQGIYDGSASAGFTIPPKTITNAVVLTSFPGWAQENIEYLLIGEMESLEFTEYLSSQGHEKYADSIEEILLNLKEQVMIRNGGETPFDSDKIRGMQCSHFSVWGDRTQQGQMFNGRNLDWFADTGIAKYKLIYIFHAEGTYSNAAIGFAGLMGAITGINNNGVFVAESDNDSVKVTFEGLTWSMRLRYIMEYSATIQEALANWEATNNTMGMNHMLSAANDVGVTQYPAYALETMARYTAYFHDNDPEEQYVFVNEENGDLTQMGHPMALAVYRTNHGYDDTIRRYQFANITPENNSFTRYMLFVDTFNYYNLTQNQIGELEAVNITSLLGDKNSTDYYSCENQDQGANVISAAFHHASNKMFVAYEEGTGSSRICACCGTYVQVDLTQFWTPNSPKNQITKKPQHYNINNNNVILKK
ncbi:hypothetical protein DLAC_03157 [Tieghemostelium lacteum]|uniref:DUSP domain-containing protein n=1 Tax=Tieghemostelium lacteum TaxID=361077 RepID=A0A152A2G0_TIELA|nr:hypothetical protein DLAC_03157 [Tieghemostelium lacteum]|eukprot:KYR00406.1 hypothetical protein DLAC_03157 [Tieghemostelium lacteum]